MKIKSVNYSITFELPFESGIERWRKIGLEIEPDKGEIFEGILDNVDKQIKTWHESRFPELYGKPKKLPVLNVSGEHITDEDKEWILVKNHLFLYETREEAQEFLDKTDFKLTLEAKKIVQNKPSKNEKK
jgi:hypothetical protein